MTPLPKGLLDDILVDPDNDTLRLIAADWFEENGEPDYGEFIRVQCWLSKMHEDFCPCDPRGFLPGAPGGTKRTCDCKWCSLRRRERALLAGPDGECCRCDWHAPMTHNGDCAGAWEYRRGFVEVITLTAADWLQYADALTAAAPIREVVLTTWPGVHYGAHSTWPSLSPGPDDQRTFRIGINLLQQRYRSVAVEPGKNREEATHLLFAGLWPRVKFTLPPTLAGFPVAANPGLQGNHGFYLLD